MKPTRISLHVDELALHGFARGDQRRIGAALERELTRLLVARGLPRLPAASPPHVPGVPPARFEAAPQASPDAVGVAVARAVYTRLSR